MSDKKKKKLPLSEFITKFDESVSEKKYNVAQVYFSALLPILESGKEGLGKNPLKMSPLSETEATILASAITTWLCDKDYTLNNKAFLLFTKFKRAIVQVFEVSGYRGTGHFLKKMGKVQDGGKTKLNVTDAPKLFCGLSINALSADLVDLLLSMDPKISCPLIIGFLSEQVLWNESAEAARSKILASANVWKDVVADDNVIGSIGPAYMGCSYSNAPHKHDIKRAMNSIVRRWLLSHKATGATFRGQRPTNKKRPKIVIIAELYSSMHAMHRCYGPAIRALKDKFTLIYMSPDGKCDDAIRDMFDVVDDTKFSVPNPKVFFDKVKSYRPDMVYYPSVGMRTISVIGSNLRLAPIQFMTFGHPATTVSSEIDYAILVDGQVGSENSVHEKILYRPTAARWQRRDDAEDIAPQIRANPGVVRMAVPAWSRKVIPLFLETCKRIQKEAGKPVEFAFFPNATGALYQAFSRRIGDMLPAKVYPRTDYNTYIKLLNRCDIFLSTFPFGATNGIIDAALQGLPVVNMTGDEVHAKNDSDIVAKFKQPKWLTTHSVDEYVAAVLRLISNDDERVEISRNIAEFDHQTGLFVPQDDHCDAFRTIVEAAYLHHEMMQESTRKSWQYNELKDLVG